jgi:hypothetical protein
MQMVPQEEKMDLSFQEYLQSSNSSENDNDVVDDDGADSLGSSPDDSMEELFSNVSQIEFPTH